MNKIEICQFELHHPYGRKDRIAILRCGIYVENPKAIMDVAVCKYVVNEPYNEFIEIHLDNPWIRVIIRGINELYYQPFKPSVFNNVEMFEHDLINTKGTVTIFRGGLDSEKPIAYMNAVVIEYVGQRGYNEFVEIHLDNPWVRVVITEINSLEYEPFKNQTINGSI